MAKICSALENDAPAMKRIAIGGLHTECSSYTPLEQVRQDFTRVDGQDLLEAVPFDWAAAGLDPVPLFQERSVPGGPVSSETFADQTREFMQMLQDQGPFDGALLLMHGAMFVPGTDDPEGCFIAEVRKILGPNAIISASFDLHGQMTQQIVDNLDGFAAYRTAPHVDVTETHQRAAQILADALQTGAPRPCVCWEPVPILASGEMTSTFVAPCDRLYAALPELDRHAGILDSNLMIGYVWADSPRATAAAVVTCTDAQAGQDMSGEIARSYRDVRDQLCFDMNAAPLEQVLDNLPAGPVVIADSGDNPTAGGMGDRADVLKAVLDRGLDSTLFAGIADPAAYSALMEGSNRISIGGSLGGGGPKIELQVQSVRFANECAIVTSGSCVIVISRFRRPFHHMQDFRDLDLDLESFRNLVVKSGYLVPDIRNLPREQVMALTDGAVCQDIARLENNHRPQGTWPFNA